MTFAIQSGIPVPTKNGTATSKYPLRDLQVGQSFFVAGAKKSTQVTLSKAAKNLGISITTRALKEHTEFDGEGNGVGDKVDGLRVWRVEAKPAATPAA